MLETGGMGISRTLARCRHCVWARRPGWSCLGVARLWPRDHLARCGRNSAV